MAKEKETKVATPATENEENFAVNNLLTDKAVADAMEEIKKEKDEKKRDAAKRLICRATYKNAKTRLKLRLRRREDAITKEELEGTKDLLERVLGQETKIENGCLVPTGKKIAKDQTLLTETQYKEEMDKLAKEISKKISESEEIYNKELAELRNSYEGMYVSWWE